MKSTNSRMSLQLPVLNTHNNGSTTPLSSLPPSPGPSTLLPAAHIHNGILDARRTILMPTVRPPRLSSTHLQTSSSRPTATRGRYHGSPKMSRSKHTSVSSVTVVADSLSAESSPVIPPPNPHDASHWFPSPCNFQVAKDQIELSGFQLYAVEKWVTERKRPVITLAVYTGDPVHKITVTALRPSLNSTEEAEREWEKGLRSLHQGKARPRETEHGTVMVTSLASFRSDWTIVHIPGGNFLEARPQLYVNISLMRMGCSGRGALTLQQPSDTTKGRFIQLYRFSEKTLDDEIFTNTVLELIKLIQAGLALFRSYSLSAEERNGLLCDVTVKGMHDWASVVGESLLGIEPTDKVAEPNIVAALFSTIINARNKLHSVGYNHLVPKDPFLEPQAFLAALAAFQAQAHGKAASPDLSSNKTDEIYLTPSLLQLLDAAFDKSKQNDAYKVHKMLRNKIDDITTDLRTAALDRSSDFSSSNPAADELHTGYGTSNLKVFSRLIVSSGKEGAPSLAWLWAGKVGQLDKRKREMQVVSDGEVDEKDKLTMGEVKTTDDEVVPFPWSGRMQKKVESWVGKHRRKTSMEPSTKKGGIPPITDGVAGGLPSLVITEDGPVDDDVLIHPHIPPPAISAQSSIRDDDSDLQSQNDRRMHEFNKYRPPGPGNGSRVSSWSDPYFEQDRKQRAKRSRLGHMSMLPNASEDLQQSSEMPTRTGTPDLGDGEPLWSVWIDARERRHSFSVGDVFPSIRILPVEYMRIDVELCGQLIVMRRRQEHLGNLVTCLDVLTNALSATNDELQSQHQQFQERFSPLEHRIAVVSEIERQRSEAEAMTQDANALAYESAQFRAADVWQLAHHSRAKAFGIRSKVFGTGRRVRQGVGGAHGRYTHLQWTLNAQNRLVDQFGRTESEAEEEEGLPRVGPKPMEEAEEPDFVPNPSIKPTWLLNFFNSWRNRWKAGANAASTDESPSTQISPNHSPPPTPL